MWPRCVGSGKSTLSNWQNKTVWRPHVLFKFQNTWLETWVKTRYPLLEMHLDGQTHMQSFFTTIILQQPHFLENQGKSNPQAEVACPAEKGPFFVTQDMMRMMGRNSNPNSDSCWNIYWNAHISVINLEPCWGQGCANFNDTICCMGPVAVRLRYPKSAQSSQFCSSHSKPQTVCKIVFVCVRSYFPVQSAGWFIWIHLTDISVFLLDKWWVSQMAPGFRAAMAQVPRALKLTAMSGPQMAPDCGCGGWNSRELPKSLGLELHE